jgi:hypothetical protein
LQSVREAIDQIGRTHFLGSLLVRASTASDLPTGALSPSSASPKARP